MKTTTFDNNPLYHIIKSRKTPSQHKDLIFEDDLVKLMHNVTFKRISNNFQDQIKADIESIKSSKNIYIFADKTNNLSAFVKSNAFVTLKYHKENLQSNPKYSLINPAKSEIGKVSKFFIENINTKVREMSSINQ